MKVRVRKNLDWDAFVSEDWDRRPVLFRGTGACPFTETAVFRSLVAASARDLSRWEPKPGPRAVQLTVNGTQLRTMRSGVPVSTDGSLSGYQTRMLQGRNAMQYALTAQSFHSFDAELWSQEHAFFSALWSRVGLPLTGAITTLFHGNYDRTPVGVHLDRFSTFLFAIRGRKRMRFWSRRPWKEPVTSLLDYARHVDSSFAVEVDAGDILYWPCRYFHVGETVDAEPATSVNVGIPRERHDRVYEWEDLAARLRPAADRRADVPQPEDDGSGLISVSVNEEGLLSPGLPRPFIQALRAYDTLSEPEHTDALWLKRKTAAGLEPPPPSGEPRRLRKAVRMRWLPGALAEGHASRTAWLGAVNGFEHQVKIPGVQVEKLLRRLKNGQPFRLDDVTRAFRNTRDAKRARAFLQWLESVRALKRDDP